MVPINRVIAILLSFGLAGCATMPCGMHPDECDSYSWEVVWEKEQGAVGTHVYCHGSACDYGSTPFLADYIIESKEDYERHNRSWTPICIGHVHSCQDITTGGPFLTGIVNTGSPGNFLGLFILDAVLFPDIEAHYWAAVWEDENGDRHAYVYCIGGDCRHGEEYLFSDHITQPKKAYDQHNKIWKQICVGGVNHCLE